MRQYKIEDIDSSLISKIYWDERNILQIQLKQGQILAYEGVDEKVFIRFAASDSYGSFYNKYIKQKFKKMSDTNKPKGINIAKKDKRFIKMRLNLTLIKKEWLFRGEKGLYADVTLHMLPDGIVDAYGNLGMITQDVPSEIYKTDKNAKGAIIGNGQEVVWQSANSEGAPGSKAGTLAKDEDFEDDLPF